MEEVLSPIATFISTVDAWVWSWPLIIILVGTHLFMTIRTRFIQRKIGLAIKLGFQKDDSAGDVSPFAALATTLSATIGTGSIVGVATAIVCGGVGSVFWMFVIGLLGIATKYSEVYIAVKYRVKDSSGNMLGGAMYALERCFPGKKWAKVVGILFCVFTAIACLGTGAAVQSNSICGIVAEYAPGVPMWVIGLVCAVLVALVIFGGINTISKVCEKIVPVMAVFYIVCCLIIICMNGAFIIDALKWICVCAFTPQAMVGGGLGFGIMTAIRYGAARGLFSNESGLGTAPLAAANSASTNPARTSLIMMSGAFWTTCVICLLTALTLITTILANSDLSAAYAVTNALAIGEAPDQLALATSTGVGLSEGFSKGLILATTAFNQIPVFGPIVLIVGMALFAYTTMLGWGWYGNRAVTYLFGQKAKKPYSVIYVLFVFLGAIGGSAILATMSWDFADIMNGLMVVPNVIAVLALSAVIA
ncbi:MAG: alanine:cation symporter family protein [Coriobacteriales bacterium]|nr:alanine:cation symporter family protein [Coriobacteriales bacterium]